MYEHDKIIVAAREQAKWYIEEGDSIYPALAGCLRAKIVDLCIDLNRKDMEIAMLKSEIQELRDVDY